jgi:hypothetical protein
VRKRPSRPPRFAAVDNNAIDGLKSILAIGLLTRLIRAKDGDDVTVETLSKSYDEGEKSLTKAMRALVEDAYVVKFKIQRQRSEEVELEDGTTETKRGGSWYTTFTVDSIPFTGEDVAAMLSDIYDAGNVKAVRVEPTHLDPRKSPTDRPRPTRLKGGVGPTCGNADPEESETANPQVGPTPPSAAPGRPTLGQGGAHIRKKTVVEDSLSGAAPAGAEQGEREAAEPKDNSDAHQVLAAFQDAGGLALNGTRTQFLQDAAELLESRPLWWLIARAKEMPGKGWTDLARHAAKSKAPFTQEGRRAPEGACLRHPGFNEDDCPRCRLDAQERIQRPRSEPVSVDGAALLASLLQTSTTD